MKTNLCIALVATIFCTFCALSIINNTAKMTRSAFMIGCMDNGKLTHEECSKLADQKVR